MFFRSPSGTSPSISWMSFSTGRLSPVRALSAHFRLALSSRRPSAQTESPASSTTTSPGTTSRPGTWSTWPSRTTLAVGADICFKLSREAAAFTVWTVPSMAFMVITARMTTVLSTSPKTAETMAARIRMTTRKSANCSRKMRSTLFFLPPCNSLEPYCFSRPAASAAVRPSSEQFSSRNSSIRFFCHTLFIRFILSGRTQKGEAFASMPCIDTKVSPFQSAAGSAPVLTPTDTQAVPATPFL